MFETMGDIIRKLRLESGITQDRLAEKIGVTPQAVSKWENNLGLPDIQQVLPLANFFGVSTDVLFGKSDTDDVNEIIRRAETNVYDNYGIVSTEGLYQSYLIASEGLKSHPTNLVLLMFALQTGVCLAYPENETFDKEHADAIYRECIRWSNLILTYSKDVNDIQHVNMVMIILHSAHGNISRARELVKSFPVRCDYTSLKMNALIEQWQGNYQNKSDYLRLDTMGHLDSLLDCIMENGNAMSKQGKNTDAVTAYTAVFDLIGIFFRNEEYLPPLHDREMGNAFELTVETYCKLGMIEQALLWVKKWVDYEMSKRDNFTENMAIHTPLMPEDYGWIYGHGQIKDRGKRAEILLKKLENEKFSNLRKSDEFISLIDSLMSK